MPQSRTPWLIVFVKAPSPGDVKTRLASSLSAQSAADLYRALALDTLQVARRLRGIHLVVAYAANQVFPDLHWCDKAPAMFLQRGSTLGERLTHAFRWAFDQQATPVVVIGSDAPDLSAAWLRKAFQALRRYDVVVGPTVDGGYHLIGLTRPHPELFVAMPWSTRKLFDQTLQRTGQLGLSVHCLEPLADLDTPDDVSDYLAQPRALRRQTHTARYLQTLSSPRAPGPVTPQRTRVIAR